jgi:hypothetical protein
LFGEITLVQVSGIPVQQNSAEVEDDGFDCHRVQFYCLWR